MPRFRRKRTEIDAEQWFPGKTVVGVTEVVHDPGDGSTVPNGYGHVVTIHGEPALVVPGDWIITEPDGVHHYPCKPDIFAATYDRVRTEGSDPGDDPDNVGY